MSQRFKLRFDELHDNDPGKDKNTGESGNSFERVTDTHYEAAGNGRMLGFAWPDGKRMFLNYAYLVCCTYLPGDETSSIELAFTSHLVVVKGYGLEALYDKLMVQQVRVIEILDLRYAQMSEKGGSMATEITISQI